MCGAYGSSSSRRLAGAIAARGREWPRDACEWADRPANLPRGVTSVGVSWCGVCAMDAMRYAMGPGSRALMCWCGAVHVCRGVGTLPARVVSHASLTLACLQCTAGHGPGPRARRAAAALWFVAVRQGAALERQGGWVCMRWGAARREAVVSAQGGALGFRGFPRGRQGLVLPRCPPLLLWL